MGRLNLNSAFIVLIYRGGSGRSPDASAMHPQNGGLVMRQLRYDGMAWSDADMARPYQGREALLVHSVID